jgi:cell division protease FtsH
MKLPLEETLLKTRSQFMADLAVSMAGYASEKETFGEMSTGASNDLKEATKLAHALVTQFGMSEKLGPMTFGDTQELIFLGKEISTEKNYSEKVAAQIDAEVKSFIDNAYKTALKIVASRKNVLDAIVKALVEKETLEHEDFYKIINSFHLKQIIA